MAPGVVLVSSDLFFITKVKEASASLNRPFAVVRSEAALEAQLNAPAAAGLLCIDLERCPLPVEALSPRVAALSSAWRVVSFFSHVHEDTAEKAQQHGLGEVLPRSRFVRVLPELLATL